MTGFSGYEVQWLFFDQGIWRLDPSGGHGSRNIKTYKRNSDIMITCFLKKQLNLVKVTCLPPPSQHTKLIYTSQLYGALGEDFSEESYESINQNLAELVSDEKKP